MKCKHRIPCTQGTALDAVCCVAAEQQPKHKPKATIEQVWSCVKNDIGETSRGSSCQLRLLTCTAKRSDLMCTAKRSDLMWAIGREGGVHEAARQLNRPRTLLGSRKPKRAASVPTMTILKEVLACQRLCGLPSTRMPSKCDLDAIGHVYLNSWIVKAGGYRKVGCSAGYLAPSICWVYCIVFFGCITSAVL
jgi:hypothetical protein